MTNIVVAGAGKHISREMEAANRARRRREMLGLSRKFVAENSTISMSSLSRWEKSGIPLHLSPHEALSWERVLGVPGGWLFGNKAGRERAAIRGSGGEPDLRAAGARARARRESLGLARTTVALAIVVRDSRLRQWEIDGVPRSLSAHTIAAWEAMLQVEPGWILGRNGAAALAPRPSEGESIVPTITAAQAITEASSIFACGRPQTAERNAALFAKRYGVNAPHGTGLAVIGEEFGLTESRACQIVGVMLAIASESGLPERLVQVFQTIEATVKRHLPCAPEQLERILRPMLGDSLSIPDATRFARDVLGKPLLALEAYIEEVASLESGEDQTVIALKAMSRTMIRAVGAAHVGLLMGQTLQLGWDAEVVRSIREILPTIEGFEWLGEQDGDNPEWFWFGEETDNNPVILAIRRVCSVAAAPLTADALMGAIDRARALRTGRDERRSTPFPMPPWHVTTDIFARASFFADKTGRYRANTQLDPSSELTGMEYELYQEFLRHRFVADRQTLSRRLVDTGKMESATLSNLLARSPIVASHAIGIYVLRGARLAADALTQGHSGAQVD
ncbi:helix-turn-helix domain-containing protein [Paraburkholderia sp. SIMBA_054]|uniref:helix-turn-helix domain-containing protein n=1 Tax=Paraburkholderia sp. SIMBA_054 TaxID=3085795 RepID=UPI00397C763D